MTDSEPADVSPAAVDHGAVLDGAFGHGYLLVTDGVAAPPQVHGWRLDDTTLRGLRLHLHPRTVCSSATAPPGTVVLLGHPVDVDRGTADGPAIARDLAQVWQTRGADDVVQQAAYLGGRWTLLLRSSAGVGELVVVPDTHATQPVFVAASGSRLALASAASLTAAALDLPVDTEALALLAELRRLREGNVAHLTGRRTTYLGVDPLIPNCLLRVTPGDPVQIGHERFWPARERVETDDVPALYRAFRDRFSRHVGLLSELGRPALSLTAGLDSRVTAALSREVVASRDGFTFTYVNPRDARRHQAAVRDVTGASAVAEALGLPHRVLRWRQPPDGGTFDVLHRATYAPLLPSRGAAHAMWADLPRDVVQLQSNCAETGTTYTRARTDDPLTPRRMARIILSNKPEISDPLVEDMFAGYQDYADFWPERLLGYDHHDLLYWEQRMGRWGYQKFQDGDLGHRILLPFNDRRLLETMLSLPYPQRSAKVLFRRVFAEVPAARLPASELPPPPPEPVPDAPPAAAGPPPRPGPTPRQRARAALETVPASARRLRAAARLPSRALARWERSRGFWSPDGWEVRAPRWVPRARARARWGQVLVLGTPIDLPSGADGARRVARVLARQGSPEQATARAAALVERYVVLVTGRPAGRGAATRLDGDGPGVPSGTVLVGDPLGSLTPTLLPGPAPALAVGGGAVRRQTEGVIPLPAASTTTLQADGWETRRLPEVSTSPERARADRHLGALLRRGPVVVALTAGSAGADLLDEALAARARGGRRTLVRTVSWWDPADDDLTGAVFAMSSRTTDLGLTHRVVAVDSGPRTVRAVEPALSAGDQLWLDVTRPAAGTVPSADEAAALEPHLRAVVSSPLPIALPGVDRVPRVD